MEPALGRDLGDVRVHTGPEAAASARSLNAKAYTSGRDVVFDSGRFAPETRAGRRLLAHELVHVVQQSRGQLSDTAPVVQRNEDGEGATGEAASCDLPLELVEAQLLSWGVEEEELGDLSTLCREVDSGGRTFRPLSGGEVRRALDTIDTLRTMGGRAGHARTENHPGRIIAAWNSHKDDLGPGAPYPTIVHFVHELERLAQANMGMSYVEAMQAMPTVRLAGARIGVNSRAIYFAAAAQAEMDVEEGVSEGEGHYVAPGAYLRELRRLRRLASRLALPPERRGTARQRREQAQIEEVGVRTFNFMRARVRTMIEVAEVQEGLRTSAAVDPSEHREPGLRQYLLPLAGPIRTLPQARTASDARVLARKLVDILGTVPVGASAHGFGSIDPHGTDHAMGLAIDLFNGRTQRGEEYEELGSARFGTFHNFGVRRRYWPFLYMLMDRYGTTTRGERPTSIHHLSPEQARELSGLLRDHGQDLAQEMEGAPEEDPAQRRERSHILREYRRHARLVLRGYTRRWQLLTRALARSGWYENAEGVRRLAEQAQEELAVSRRGFGEQSPVRVMRDLERRVDLLEDLYERGTTATETAEDWASTQALVEQTMRDAELAAALEEIDEEVELARMVEGGELERLEGEIEDARARRAWREARRLLRERRAARRRLGRVEGRAARRRRRAERRRRSQRASAGRARRREARRRDREHRVLERVRPEAEVGRHSLRDLLDTLKLSVDDAQEATQAERREETSRLVSQGGFQRWLDVVTEPERPIYDQPSTVVNSINRVIGHPDQARAGLEGPGATHFYGGHHWQVVDRSVLTDDGAYVEALRRDMEQERRRAMMPRVLGIMAESAGGRRILTGGQEHDLFMEALREAGYSDAEALVEESLGSVPPAEEATTPLAQHLRGLGLHYLAGGGGE